MEVDLVLKVAGVGMIVAVVCQVLAKIGRDEHATLVSVCGILVVLLLLAQKMGDLIGTIRGVFGL